MDIFDGDFILFLKIKPDREMKDNTKKLFV